MSEELDRNITVTEGTPRWLGLGVVVLAGVSLLSLGIGWNASRHAKEAEKSVATEVKTLHQNVDLLTQRLGQAEEVNAQVQGELSVVTNRLKLTRGELASARHQTKQVREDYSKKLADMQTSVQSELSTKASSEDVEKLGTDVSGVRSDLDATKQGLQMARGEFGTLIARNHDEIEQLRRLGQRDYVEFTLDRKGARQKVGDLMVELRGTNTKKHQFTLALYVDDMRLEKKNRSVNEPIYFYTRSTRGALELVVNKVDKHKVVGYVSIPKTAPASQTAASGN